MSKRILVAESSDTVRGVAETILRQNGYEVLSVPSAQKLLEVLEFSLPDMMLISADLKTEDGRACYDPIQDNPRTSAIPLLILAGNESQDLPFPPEVVIPRPFDPRDLIQRVQVFSGQSEPRAKSEGAHPLGDATLDDDLLDAALGLDRIDVTESEVLDKTGHIVQKAAAKANKAAGMAHSESDDDEESRSGKVESLMIHDEHSEIAQKHSVQAKKKQASPGTSKLEIMDDQYGFIDTSGNEVILPMYDEAHSAICSTYHSVNMCHSADRIYLLRFRLLGFWFPTGGQGELALFMRDQIFDQS